VYQETECMFIIECVRDTNVCYAVMIIVSLESNKEKGKEKGKS
jgi:hypothetical protein